MDNSNEKDTTNDKNVVSGGEDKTTAGGGVAKRSWGSAKTKKSKEEDEADCSAASPVVETQTPSSVEASKETVSAQPSAAAASPAGPVESQTSSPHSPLREPSPTSEGATSFVMVSPNDDEGGANAGGAAAFSEQPTSPSFAASALLLNNGTFNPKKKDKYKFKDSYEDHTDGIHVEAEAAAAAAEPPQSQTTNSSPAAAASSPLNSTNNNNAFGGACGGLKSQLTSPNSKPIAGPSSSDAHGHHHHHHHHHTAGNGPTASHGGDGDNDGIQIARNPKEGKEARRAHFCDPNAHTSNGHHHHHNSSGGSAATRDTSVIVSDKNGALTSSFATTAASPPPADGGKERSNSNTFGPNSEAARPQLVSLCNPDSLLGDYIPLPEDAIPPLTFRVVKQHHRMGWLKQSRLIVVTGSDLRNCKEGSGDGKKSDKEKDKASSNNFAATSENNNYNSGDFARSAAAGSPSSIISSIDASATKIIPFSSITRLSLTSKSSFAVHVLGDHTYFYISDHSLEIVWAIRKRMSICAAIAKLVRGTTAGEEQLRDLARAFMVDELTLPQFSAGADFFASGGSGGGDDDEKQSKKDKARTASGLDSVFATDRAAAEALRYATNMKNRMAIIDALKNNVLPDEGKRIRKLIDACGSRLDIQNESTVSLRNIRSAMDELRDSISELITNPDARYTKQQVKQLPDIYDVSVARAVSDEAIQTVLLTAVHGNIWAALHLKMELLEQEARFAQQCRFLRTEVTPLELGVPEKCLDFHYDLVLETIRKIATAKTPHVMLEEITACCKSIVLTITAGTQFGFTRADLPHSLLPCASGEGEGGSESAGSPSSPSGPKESSADELARKKKEKEATAAARKRTATLAADDILPILIFLIIHSHVNDLVYVREYINTLGDPEEASERSYYYTMFSSAIEYVLASAEEVKRMREFNARKKEKEERKRERDEAKRREKEREEAEAAAAEKNQTTTTTPPNTPANVPAAPSSSHLPRKSVFGSPDTDAVYESEEDEETLREEAAIEARNREAFEEAERLAKAKAEKEHLMLSRGGSIGRFKAADCPESFGKVVPDTTPLSEVIARIESKEAEKLKILSSLSSDVLGAAILGGSGGGTPVRSDSGAGTRGGSGRSNATPLTQSIGDGTAAAAAEGLGNGSFVDPSSFASVPTPSTSPTLVPSATFISPFSAFVQNDVTLNFKRQALIRHQNSTNYNKKATSASSPYAIHNLMKNNPMGVNLGLFNRVRGMTTPVGAVGSPSGGGEPAGSQQMPSTRSVGDENGGDASDVRPRGLTAPDNGSVAGSDLPSSYRYV